MAADQGMGNCLIPGADGLPCGKQINEGEAIGTIVLGGPRVGHKKCSDAYHARVQEAEREKRLNMVKRLDQGGPGGAVVYSSERDAIMGSIPLDHKPGDPLPPDVPQPHDGPDPSLLSGLAAAAGVANIANVPMDATPDEAVAMAMGEGYLAATVVGHPLPAAPESMQPDAPSSPADELADKWFEMHKGKQADLDEIRTEMGAGNLPKMTMVTQPPDVRAENGMVTLSNLNLDEDGKLWLDPEDAESLADVLKIHIKRAWRQR
jgi:hypothetical protein